MSVKIAGNSTGTDLEVETTAKAARVLVYDSLGTYRGVKPTYRAASTVGLVAAASAQPFFLLYGSSTKTIIVQRVRVMGPTLTAVAYMDLTARKYSTAHSGGTPTVLVQVPHDSNSPAGSAATCSFFVAAPTAGTLVGTLACRRVLAQAAVAVAAGVLEGPVEFDFRAQGEASGVVLRGTTQGLGLGFGAAPATAVTLGLEVEWTEE